MSAAAATAEDCGSTPSPDELPLAGALQEFFRTRDFWITFRADASFFHVLFNSRRQKQSKAGTALPSFWSMKLFNIQTRDASGAKWVVLMDPDDFSLDQISVPLSLLAQQPRPDDSSSTSGGDRRTSSEEQILHGYARPKLGLFSSDSSAVAELRFQAAAEQDNTGWVHSPHPNVIAQGVWQQCGQRAVPRLEALYILSADAVFPKRAA